MNQSRGLGDSIVAQWMVCANFCNTIGTSETYEVGQLWSAVGVTPDIRPLTAQDRVLPEAVICRTEIPQRKQSPALQRCAIRFDRRRPPHPPRLRTSWPARGDPMKRREFIRLVGGAARAAWRHTGRLPPGVSADALFSGQMRRETNISMERPPIIPAKRSIPGQILSGGPQLWTKVMIRTSPAWVPI